MSLALATKGVISTEGTGEAGETVYILDLAVAVEVDDCGGRCMIATLEIQQGEGKWVKFTVTHRGVPLDLSGVSLLFAVKKYVGDEDCVYKVEDGEDGWDTSEAVDGIVRANVPASVTAAMAVGKYAAQARFILTADTDVDKTQKLTIQIIPAVI